jgi:YtkA-like
VTSSRPTFLTLLLAGLFLSACGGPAVRGSADVDMRLEVVPEPASVGPVMLTVAVTDMTWRPLNGAAVEVQATPPTEGNEYQPYTAVGIGAGKYQIPNFPLDEPGEWIFTMRVELAGGSWAELDASIRVEEDQDG